MAKPVTILNARHFGGHTLFILRVNDGRIRPYNGIIIKGTHKEYKAVNDPSIHVKELYNFSSIDKIETVAKKYIELRKKGSWGKYPPGTAIWGERNV